MFTWNIGTTILALRNEPTYSLGSVDNERRYSEEYVLGDGRLVSSKHGLICTVEGLVRGSAILAAEGGASGVHAHSLLSHDDRCFVAVGRYICALRVPTLELDWSLQIDSATCFGVYETMDRRAIISHGELEIARVTFDGAVVWNASGADIFSEGIEIRERSVRVMDFERRVYSFDVETGNVSA